MKLKMTWTPEMASDIYSLYSIDAEAELNKILSDEIDKAIAAGLREKQTKIDLETFYDDYEI